MGMRCERQWARWKEGTFPLSNEPPSARGAALSGSGWWEVVFPELGALLAAPVLGRLLGGLDFMFICDCWCIPACISVRDFSKYWDS